MHIKTFVSNGNEKDRGKINKPIYLGQAVLDLSKTLMFEFWYDYLKPMYGDKIRLCYTDTDSFIMHIKTDDFYKDISADVDKWFDTSNFNKNRPLEIAKNKKVLGKFKDEIGGKIMTKFVALREKTYSFLIDEYTDEDYEKNRIVNKKLKEQKNVLLREKSYLIIILIHCLKIKYCIDHNNDLEVIITKCIQKKSIKLH